MTGAIKWSVLLLTILMCSMTQGQNRYSYVEDLSFSDPTDFFGYQFVPAQKEIPRSSKFDLGPGDYSFGITANNVYVKYGPDKILYNTQSIQPTEYGYLLSLLNASNIAQKGHLKIILDRAGQARALVLKKEELADEEIYHLPQLDDFIKRRDREFYTDVIDLVIEKEDSLWNKEAYPYFMDDFAAPLRTVLQIKDTISFSFYEDIVIEEKKKNRKDSVPVVDPETFDYKSVSQDSLDQLSEYISVDHKKFLAFHYAEQQENGDYIMKENRHIIEKIKEKEDETARGLQERYMWELDLKKGGPIYLFFTEYRSLSSIEYEGRIYKMRYVP
jgi:hypothetical protein